MRWIFMLLIFPLSIVRAQVIDDFSDGDFTANPQWLGSTELFRVDSSSGMLQLYAPAQEGEADLFTTSASMEGAVWQFRFKMGFNPSSANYAKVYLAAQYADRLNPGDAFYLVLGTTADNISLWEQRGGVSRKLIDGAQGRLNLSSVDAQVRVTRRKGGLFILECNPGDGWVEEGRYEGSMGMPTDWLGICCYYTSTRSKLFYFDDFVVTGEVFKDTIPPVVTQFEVVNRYQFRLLFSKPADRLHLNPDCFFLEPGVAKPEVSLIEANPYAVNLLYRMGIPLDETSAFTITGLTDVEGNAMADTTFLYRYTPAAVQSAEVTGLRELSLCFSDPLDQEKLTTSSFCWVGQGPNITGISDAGQNCIGLALASDYPNGQQLSLTLKDVVSLNGDTIDTGPYSLFYYQAVRNDIVVTEVMADPSPAVLLPESEYIELFNRGEFPVNLKGYHLSVGDTEVLLDELLLFPGDYLLLVPAGIEPDWQNVPLVLPISGWPILTNSEGEIVLRDRERRVISALKYCQSFGSNGYKREGGWSLEIIDADNLSGDDDNRTFSNDESGGTPGRINSVAADNPDLKSPELMSSYLKDSSVLVLEFSEPMDSSILNNPSLTSVEPTTLQIEKVQPDEVFLKTIEFHFTQPMPEDRLFELVFQTLPVDLAGNRHNDPLAVQFGWPVEPQPGQVVINELLFDPPVGGQDYLELYNASDHLLDLSLIYVSRANADGIPEKLVGLSDQIRIFPPKSYRVFSPDKAWILHNWSPEDRTSVQPLADLPNYQASVGTVFVTNVSGGVLDRFDYSERMHFGLLGQTKGVSLERIDAATPTQEQSNWHSAASVSGFGTPGMVNSQAAGFSPPDADDFIAVEPEIFFPNQDGFQDLLFLNYSFGEAGNTCTVTIFNREGRPVRHLVNNRTAAREGFFTWDGLDDQGARCPSGIYLVWAQSFNLKGDVRETRKIAVLGSGKP